MASFDQIVYGVLMLLIVAILVTVAPTICGSIDNVARDVVPGDYASGTIDFSGSTLTENQSINVSSETYRIMNLTLEGANDEFEVPMSATAALAATNFTTEVNANSTLVRAIDNGDDSVTVYALIDGTGGNAYATTENVTNAAWRQTTLRGGIESDWNRTSNPDMPNGADQWSDNITIASITILGLFAVLLIGAFIKMRTK